MSLLEKYEKKYAEFVSPEDGIYYDMINKSYKISGNVFAYFLRNEIKGIIDNKYKLSNINAFIKGSNVEWDMLILKKSAVGDYNIYLPEDVICAFEFKTSGAIRNNKPNEAIEYIQKEIDNLNYINTQYKANIRYGYISLCEHYKNLDALKEYFKDKCFWIIEGPYGSRKHLKCKESSDLKTYIDKLLI